METKDLTTTPPLDEPIDSGRAFPRWKPSDQQFLLKHADPAEAMLALGDVRITAWERAEAGLLFFYRPR